MTALTGLPTGLLTEHPGLNEWAFLHGYRGSVAHGMYIPSDDPDSIDDIDTMAFCVPPLETYFGLQQFGSRGTQEIKVDPWDIVIYEARKAISLLLKGNPNVMSMLWLRDEHYIKVTDTGRRLISHRDWFMGRHLYEPFVGYAQSQLAKMTRGVFKGYMGERRKALVERHGYDTKNAAHLIRLLRMGIEALDTGKFIVYRPDAEELLSIKRGEWPLERVQREAMRLFDEARRARARSCLPERPDRERIEDLLCGIVYDKLLVALP